MTAKKKDNTTLIIVIAVVGMLLVYVLPVVFLFGIYALIGGGALGFMFFLKPGDAHVRCPQGQDYWVTIDDEQPDVCLSGTSAKYHLKRGKHLVLIEGQKTGDRIVHEIDVGSGFYNKVLPVHEDQCFVRLDVTEHMYTGYYKKGEGIPPPEIVELYDPHEPFDMPSSSYLSEEDLPESMGEEYAVYLVLDVHCDMLERTDDEILEHLDF